MDENEQLVYRVEVEDEGKRKAWVVVAHDLGEAADRAEALARTVGARVLAIQLVAPLL